MATVYVVSGQSSATANPEIRQFFSQVDADADHRITLPEVEAFFRTGPWLPGIRCGAQDPCTLPQYAAHQMARADADQSGALSHAEFAAVNYRDWAEDFLMMDADANGAVSAEDVLRFNLNREAGGSPAADCLARSGPRPTCEATPQARAAAQDMIAAYDTDRSGTVTLVEYMAQ